MNIPAFLLKTARGVPLIALLLLGALSYVYGQAPGAKYGARDPRTCEPDKSPTLTAATASKLFTCSQEKDAGDYLYLIADLKLEMGAARKYQTSDTYADIDPTLMVYPIRGTFTRYQCSRQFNIDADHSNLGKNCTAYPQPQAQGLCYHTTFGDWSCKMFDRVTSSETAKMHVPPPQ